MTKRKIRWGILGLGNIAHQFASDLVLIPEAELHAVASRSMKKAIGFSAEFGAKKAFGSYKELLADPEVDIVYIATPHNSHTALSIAAMQHQKAVLCEKPVAINSAELDAMIATAKTNNVFFMEAFWSRFNPSIIKIKQLIDKGEIGEVKNIDANFSCKVDAPEYGRMYAMELIGGSLLDMGVYPIFLSYFILGLPKNIMAKAHFHTTGADVHTAMIFDYDNAFAMLYSSFVANSDMIAKINGTEGQLYIHNAWHETSGYTLVKNGKEKNYGLPKIGKGFSHEILECHSCLLGKKKQSALWSWGNSKDLIGIVDQVRAAIGLEYPSER